MVPVTQIKSFGVAAFRRRTRFPRVSPMAVTAIDVTGRYLFTQYTQPTPRPTRPDPAREPRPAVKPARAAMSSTSTTTPSIKLRRRSASTCRARVTLRADSFSFSL